MSGGSRSPEYQQALADFGEFLDVGGQAGQAGQAGQDLQELSALMAQAGLATGASGGAAPAADFGQLSEVEQQFIFNWLKNRLADLIKKLYSYVNRYYDRLRDCIPAVTETVRLFSQGSYARGLLRGGQALACILSKL